MGCIANHKYFGVSQVSLEIRIDFHPPHSVSFHAKPRAGRRRHYACGPDDCGRRNALCSKRDAVNVTLV